MTSIKKPASSKSLFPSVVGFISGLISGAVTFSKFCEKLSISLNGSSDEIWAILIGIALPAVFGIIIGLLSQNALASLLIPIIFAFVTNIIWVIISVIVGIIFTIINEPESMLWIALLTGLCSAPVAGFFLIFIE